MPSSRISPSCGAWMPWISRVTVVLPEPERPTTPMIWPGSISKETRSSAGVAAPG